MQTELEDGLLTKENKYAAEVFDEASFIGKKVPVCLETEKIDRLTSEVESIKVMLIYLNLFSPSHVLVYV